MSSKEKFKLYKDYASLRQAIRRKTVAEQKRFTDPLVIYLEKTYPEVMYNYKEFYKHLDQANPQKKDLTKTEMFRKWLNQPPQNTTTSEPINHKTEPCTTVATTSKPTNYPLLDIPNDILNTLDWDFDSLVQYLHPYNNSEEEC